MLMLTSKGLFIIISRQKKLIAIHKYLWKRAPVRFRHGQTVNETSSNLLFTGLNCICIAKFLLVVTENLDIIPQKCRQLLNQQNEIIQ